MTPAEPGNKEDLYKPTSCPTKYPSQTEEPSPAMTGY